MKWFLGFLWLLPATVLVWTFYILPAWALRWIRWDGSPRAFVGSFVLLDSAASFYSKYWEHWAGWSGPCVIILKKDPDDDLRYIRTRLHELRHCEQQFLFGVFHYPCYVLAMLFIYLFCRKLHPYYDNPFERDARRAAGQPVDIPVGSWKKSRWPWW